LFLLVVDIAQALIAILIGYYGPLGLSWMREARQKGALRTSHDQLSFAASGRKRTFNLMQHLN
jgi:hypothetical protein